ncbi:hypothetical protein H6785_01055 [Candidatus Nomurabacteria bacterium]|nr:hypothetical protein [Candidatus Kaiserbacteria bacterium]MCB9815158.1 hypothetical protein [Candidatus Nomurabacteria bacterium]
MNPKARLRRIKENALNKSFYRFVFSFIAVIAGVLLFILIVGVGSGVQ